MAPAKNISFLFILILFFSMQIDARESQFFSKVPSVKTINGAQETTVIPNKEETLSKQEQADQPTFTSESNTQGSYGLYGHESNRQLPPATTTTTGLTNADNGAPYTPNPTNHVPFQTEFEDDESLNKFLDTNDNNYDNNDQRNYNNFYNSKNRYEANQNGLVDTRLTANQNNYYSGANGQYYNVEKQGMSDTRFLENGKYYYDINSENNYNPNQYGNSRSGVNSRPIWYGNKGYYHGNNDNSFEHNKHYSMDGYNQNGEDQFQQEQDEFVP